VLLLVLLLLTGLHGFLLLLLHVSEVDLFEWGEKSHIVLSEDACYGGVPVWLRFR